MFDQILEVRPELLVVPGLASDGSPWSWGEYLSAIVVSGVGFSAWPHLFMKSFTARDDQTLRRAAMLFPTFQIFLVPLFLIGFAGVLFQPPPEAADQILPHMLMHLELPAFVVGLFCAGALAASMSSGDSMLHAAASIMVRDGSVAAWGARPSPDRERTLIRVWVVLLMLAAYLLAVLYTGSLVSLLLWAYGPIVQFAPVLVATLFLKRFTTGGVLMGLIGGTVVTLTLFFLPDLRPWPLHSGLYGLGVNVLGLVLGSMIWPEQDPERASAFLAVARQADAGSEAASSGTA